MFKYLMMSSILFFMGILGLFFVRKHMIILLLAIEVIFLAINFNFLIFSVFLDDLLGQFYALAIITIAASESAIGLAILVMFYSLRGSMSLDMMNLLKG